jgi:cobyrinic acid a,c-diamide synthase
MLLTLPRIVLAGVSSGVGKTTITTAVIAQLLTRGIQVQPFKVGPDYIDPSHLALAAARPCYNLDTWIMPSNRMLDVFCRAAAAAVVMGFQHLDPEVHIVGVIANHVGGAGHAHLLQESIETETGIPLLGYFRHSPDNLVPERHLGLVLAAERVLSAQQLTLLGEQFGQTCDSERLFALACEAPPIEENSKDPFSSIETTGGRVSIAIAQDEAFNFYYPDTLDLLRLAGAELVPFSPLHEAVLPEHIGGIYIGGGFPEEYAHRLSANESMRAALAQLLEQDMPCYAECGGLMYLCQSIRIATGEKFPMVGVIARQSVMSNDRGGLVIGYREAAA